MHLFKAMRKKLFLSIIGVWMKTYCFKHSLETTNILYSFLTIAILLPFF